jgi:hypothetical protein
MESISKKAIYDRVALFVQCVHSSDSSINLGFQPNNHWWISHDTDTNIKKHPRAFTFLQQIGISVGQMEACYGKFWLRDLESFFPSLLKRQFKKTNCICVLLNDLEMTKMAPSDENIVGGVFHATRNTKSPWHTLRDEICEINSSLNPFSPTEIRSKKKRKVDSISEEIVNRDEEVERGDYDPISFAFNYWDSSEAKILFGTQDPERNALESIEVQLKLMKEALYMYR